MYFLVTNNSKFQSKKFTKISLQDSLKKLESLKEIQLDTETSGLDFTTKKVLLLQLGCFDFQIVYDIMSFGNQFPKELIDFLQRKDKLFILHNAKFDLTFLFSYGIIVNNVYDTFLVESIINNGLPHTGLSLKDLSERYLNINMDKTVRSSIISMTQITEPILEYACLDVKYLSKIREKQMEQVDKYQLRNAIKLDNNFVKVLAYIEFCGIKLDYDKWKNAVEEKETLLNEAEKELNKYVIKNKLVPIGSGMVDIFTNEVTDVINWRSSIQVKELFKKIGVNVIGKGGKESIDEKTLKSQIPDFELLQKYFQYQGYRKAVETYGYDWKQTIRPATGRIHTNFNQLQVTGRLSSGKKGLQEGIKMVNLQNLPSDEFTRSCFVAEKGHKIVAIDYSAQESIVLVNETLDESLLNFYRKGLTDLHVYVAIMIYPYMTDIPLSEITNDDLLALKKKYPKERQSAKSVEFAVAYGGNEYTIANNLGVSIDEGRRIYNTYFRCFYGMKNYFKNVLEKCKQNKYIEYNSITKRKCFIDPQSVFYKFCDKSYIPLEFQNAYFKQEGEITRNAMNYPIQGTSSDITKLAGIYFFNYIVDNGYFNTIKMINCVHDEWLIEVPEELTEFFTEILLSCMRKAADVFCRTIKLDASPSVGDYWIH